MQKKKKKEKKIGFRAFLFWVDGETSTDVG